MPTRTDSTRTDSTRTDSIRTDWTRTGSIRQVPTRPNLTRSALIRLGQRVSCSVMRVCRRVMGWLGLARGQPIRWERPVSALVMRAPW